MKTKSRAVTVALLSFAVVACAIAPALIANAGRLYLVGDYMTQQIPFMLENRRVILSGTPFWSCNTFFGANFAGTYSFYVYGSPFFWPLLLVPERFMSIGVGFMFVAKHIVAALTSFFYLRRHTGRDHFAVIGALIYTFSSFTLDSTFYYHFLDVIALFPLIPLFADAVLENRKKPLLALAAFICAVTNYYFFIATSIFFLIYLFFRALNSKEYQVRDCVRCIVYYAIGGLMAAVVLLPSALALLETSKATGSFGDILPSALATIPQIFKILKGIVLPSEGILGSATGFVYSSYCSNAAFLPFFGALFLFVALRSKEAAWEYRINRFLFILTLVPFGNGLFSLLSNLNYTRWWYAFVLMMITAALKTLDRYELNREDALREYRRSAKTVLKIGLGVTVPFVVIKLLSAYVLNDFIMSRFPKPLLKYLVSSGLTQKFDPDVFRYFAVLVLLTLISYLPLFSALKRWWIYRARAVVPAVAVICLFSYSLYLCNECGWFTAESRDSVVDRLSDSAASEEVSYSSRTSFGTTLGNYSMVVNEPGVKTFNSFKSHATAGFCRIAGYEVGSMPTTRAFYTTPSIQTVLSISSVVQADGSRSAAECYAPFGYEYKHYVIDSGFEFTRDKAENNRRIELMAAACIVDEETAARLNGIISPLEEPVPEPLVSAHAAASTACVSFTMNSAGLSAVSRGENERLIYFSIPHDKGWRARVNGSQTEILTLNGGMMGIIVPEGEAEIEFSFVPPGLAAGAAVSLLAVAALVAVSPADRKSKKKYTGKGWL